MKDKRLEQQLQDSLNRTLSGVRTTSFQREQFFENATGGRKVKRKLTYILHCPVDADDISAFPAQYRRWLCR